MQYRKLGKTGLEISALGFGGMRLPSKMVDGRPVFDHEEGAKIINRALDLGVNYVDTAPMYCNGQSEVIVGKALKGRRSEVNLSTKYRVESPDPDKLRSSLEASLEKLGTDYLDIFYMWGISWDTYTKNIDVPNGALSAALKAKDEGLIKHLSFSFHDKPENLIKIIDTDTFESVLCQYNILDRSNEEGIAHAHKKGLGVTIMGPVGGGRLGEPSEIISKLLKDKSASTAETALRFVLSNQNVSCALSGMGSMAMVEENVKTASNEAALSAEEISAINASMEENKKLADLYCTGCNYCMPCPAEVSIPAIFRLMNYHKIYNITDYSKQQYAMIGKIPWMPGNRADACTECGQCEEKCPQHIPIIEQLKESHAALG